MSITVSSPTLIHNSPLNTSPTKQLYSFSRNARFSAQTQSLCDKIYNLPSTKDKRSAGIGYGTKSNFFQNANQSPPPNAYNIQTDINVALQKKQGWSMALGRETSPQFGIFALGNSQKSLPGPGNYKSTSSLSNIKYTMRPKPHIRTPAEIQNFPGPGTYQDIPGINKSNRYPISKYKSYGSTVFNPSSSQRFSRDNGDQVPGPGQYKDYKGMDPVGKYFNSKFETQKVRSFSHAKRITFSSLSNNPGPGNYRLPSDFGHYESSKVQHKRM